MVKHFVKVTPLHSGSEAENPLLSLKSHVPNRSAKERFRDFLSYSDVCEGQSFTDLANRMSYHDLMKLEIARRSIFLKALTNLGRKHHHSFDAENAFIGRTYLSMNSPRYINTATIGTIAEDLAKHLNIQQPYLPCEHSFTCASFPGQDNENWIVHSGAVLFDKQITEALKQDAAHSAKKADRGNLVNALKKLMEFTQHDYLHHAFTHTAFGLDNFILYTNPSSLSERSRKVSEAITAEMNKTFVDSPNERIVALVHYAVCQELFEKHPGFRKHVIKVASSFFDELKDFGARIRETEGEEKALSITSTIAYFGLVHLNQVLDVAELLKNGELDSATLIACCGDVDLMMHNMRSSNVVQPPLVPQQARKELTDQALGLLVHTDTHLRMTLEHYDQTPHSLSPVPVDMVHYKQAIFPRMYWQSRPRDDVGEATSKLPSGRILPMVGDPLKDVRGQSATGSFKDDLMSESMSLGEYRALVAHRRAS